VLDNVVLNYILQAKFVFMINDITSELITVYHELTTVLSTILRELFTVLGPMDVW